VWYYKSSTGVARLSTREGAYLSDVVEEHRYQAAVDGGKACIQSYSMFGPDQTEAGIHEPMFPRPKANETKKPRSKGRMMRTRGTRRVQPPGSRRFNEGSGRRPDNA
jgi:hypothetical protein